MKIILASKSPRRQELLKEANIEYQIIPSTIEEVFNYEISVEAAVMDLAYQKAASIKSLVTEDDLIIGADTIVVIDNEVLGKPKNYEDAIRMLKMLENKSHQVLTGVCLIKGNKEITFYEKTDVYFKPMTLEDIERYIAEENVYDKAGSYAIQGEAMRYIDHIEGDYYNVIGLPVERLLREIQKI